MVRKPLSENAKANETSLISSKFKKQKPRNIVIEQENKKIPKKKTKNEKEKKSITTSKKMDSMNST